jgi:hypothetical protein
LFSSPPIIDLVGGDSLNIINGYNIMKISKQITPVDTSENVIINLSAYAKIEQAELLARFLLNSNYTDKKEFTIAVSCIADLLCSVMKKAK